MASATKQIVSPQSLKGRQGGREASLSQAGPSAFAGRKRFIILEYKNGIYQGDISVAGEREGMGVFIWDSGELYFGEWEKDLITGQGILYFPCGGYLHGFFKNNKVHGFAKLLFPNNDTYVGEWSEGKLNGKCFKQFVERCCWLVCEYKPSSNFCQNCNLIEFLKSPLLDFNLLANKRATEEHSAWLGFEYRCISFSDGGKYLGVAKNELPNGLGILHYSDGKTDLGFYKDGVLDGFGRLNFLNGDLYDGMMKEGLFEGQGVFYQKETNKWIFGSFSANRCSEVADMGDGLPREIMEFIKSEQHRTSKYYRDITVPNDVFVIPKMSDDSERQRSQMKSPTQGNKKKMSGSKEIGPQKKTSTSKTAAKQDASSQKSAANRSHNSQESKQKKASSSNSASVLTEVSQNMSSGSLLSNNLFSPKQIGGGSKQSAILNATNTSQTLKSERNQSLYSAEESHPMQSNRSGVSETSLFPASKQMCPGPASRNIDSSGMYLLPSQRPNESNILPRMSVWSSNSCQCPDCVPGKSENLIANQQVPRESYYSPGRIENVVLNTSAAENMKFCSIRKSEKYFGSPIEKLETPFKEEVQLSSQKHMTQLPNESTAGKTELCTCSDCLQNFTQRLQKSIERNPSKRTLLQNSVPQQTNTLAANASQLCDCRECANRMKTDISHTSSQAEASNYGQHLLKSPSSLLNQNSPQMSYMPNQSYLLQQSCSPAQKNVQHSEFEATSPAGPNADLGISRAPAFRDEPSYSNASSVEPRASCQVFLDKSLRMPTVPAGRPQEIGLQPHQSKQQHLEVRSVEPKASFVSRSDSSSVTSNYSYTSINNSSADFSRSIYGNEREKLGGLEAIPMNRFADEQQKGAYYSGGPESTGIGKITRKIPGMIVSKAESQERMEERVKQLIQQKMSDGKEDLILKEAVSKLENQTDNIARTLESLKLQLSDETSGKQIPSGVKAVSQGGHNNSMLSCDFLLSRTEMNITNMNIVSNRNNLTTTEHKPVDTSNLTLNDKSAAPFLAMSFTKKDCEERMGQLPNMYNIGEPALSHQENSFSSINLSNILPGPCGAANTGSALLTNFPSIGKPPMYPKFFSSEKKDEFSLNSPFGKDDIRELSSTPKEPLRKDPDPGLNIKLQPSSEIDKLKTSDFQTVLFPDHTIPGGDSSHNLNNLSGHFIDKSSLINQPLISCSFSDLSPIRNTAHEQNNNSLLLPNSEQGCPVNSSSPFLGAGTLDLGPKQNYEIVQKYGAGIEKIDERLEEQNESMFLGEISRGGAKEIRHSTRISGDFVASLNLKGPGPSTQPVASKAQDLDSAIALQHEEVKNLYKKFKPTKGGWENESPGGQTSNSLESGISQTKPMNQYMAEPQGQIEKLIREGRSNFAPEDLQSLREKGNY